MESSFLFGSAQKGEKKMKFEDLTKKEKALAIANHNHLSGERWSKDQLNKQLAKKLGVDLREFRRIVHARVQPIYGI